MVTDATNTQQRLQALIVTLHRSGITMSEAEREFRKLYLRVVLTEFNWNQLRAARALEIHRNTLSRHLHELRINPRVEKQLNLRKPVRRASAHAVSVQQTA